jgi:hypothetical protein
VLARRGPCGVAYASSALAGRNGAVAGAYRPVAYRPIWIDRAPNRFAPSRHTSRLVPLVLTKVCMWLCYLSECSSANDGFAVMSGVVVSAAVVRLRCAALGVARDRNSFGFRSGRTAQERAE